MGIIKRLFTEYQIDKETVTAEFLGWQEMPNGEHVALYNVNGGKLDKSTVTLNTLIKKGIKEKP